MKSSVKFYHWIPRILCILAILFIGMFSLDVFEPGLSVGQQITGFLMHNIPSFILIILLIVAWKWEYVGGIIFIILGIIMSVPVFMLNYRMNHSVPMSLLVLLMITFPIALVGVLFIVSYKKKQNKLKIKANI